MCKFTNWLTSNLPLALSDRLDTDTDNMFKIAFGYIFSFDWCTIYIPIKSTIQNQWSAYVLMQMILGGTRKFSVEKRLFCTMETLISTLLKCRGEKTFNLSYTHISD